MGLVAGPLLAGLLVQGFGYEGGFVGMALISLTVFLLVWYGLSRRAEIPAAGAARLSSSSPLPPDPSR